MTGSAADSGSAGRRRLLIHTVTSRGSRTALGTTRLAACAIPFLGALPSLRPTTVPEFRAACQRSQLGITPLDGFALGDLKILNGAQIRDFDPKTRLKPFTRDKSHLQADR